MKGGYFVNKDGDILGEHAGYPFYTVGQRRGLGKAFGAPVYVTEIRPETNQVVLGDVDELIRNSMQVGQVNWQKYPGVPPGTEAITKIRYRDNGTLGELFVDPAAPDRVRVDFLANVRGVAPGQSAVFYEGDDLIGGGIIYSGR